MKIRYYLFVLFLLFLGILGNAQTNDTVQIQKLDEIIIKAESKTHRLRKEALPIQVIDTKKISHLPVDLTLMLNSVSGVRMRKSGGLGANYTLIINGFQDHSIRYFKDGIPMDYLGPIFNLSSIPLNTIQRVEIYQGMLPAHLGADALGGAINIVSQENSQKSFLNISADLGSFNTYRFSLNSKWINTTKTLYAGVNSFYNHSDNSYKVSVPIKDENTSNIKFEKLRLFHNQFTNYYTEIYTGIQHKKWADNLRFSLIGFNIKRNHNYGNTMDRAYGGIHSKMYSVLPTLRYQKKFLDKKISIDQFWAYSNLKTSYTDTIKGSYDWKGNFTSIPSNGGESSSEGSLANLKFKNFISRTLLKGKLSDNSKITFNAVFNSIKKTGSDPFGKKLPLSGKDILSEPSIYKKLALAIGLDSKWCDYKLSNQFLIKYFHLETSGVDTYITSVHEEKTVQNIYRWGIADAIKYKFNNDFFTRISAEWTTRLPYQGEFFGDGMFTLPNLKLQPETSLNFNAGLHYEVPEKWNGKLNLFYRYTKDMIKLVDNGFFSLYKNIQNVKGFGIELDSYYQVVDFLKLKGNITYQEFRLFGQEDATYRGARLPNIPYFFANIGVHFNKKNTFKKGDALKIYWLYNYVKSFYIAYVPREMEPNGFLGLWGKPKVNLDDLSIPNQHLHSIGVTWIPNNNWSIGLGVRNVFNYDIFDNFKIQNAGRSFNIKINYSLKYL